MRKIWYKISAEELAQLREVARTATMRTANFNGMDLPGDTDALIKSRTELWRYSWIVNPLQEIISAIEARK